MSRETCVQPVTGNDWHGHCFVFPNQWRSSDNNLVLSLEHHLPRLWKVTIPHRTPSECILTKPKSTNYNFTFFYPMFRFYAAVAQDCQTQGRNLTSSPPDPLTSHRAAISQPMPLHGHCILICQIMDEGKTKYWMLNSKQQGLLYYTQCRTSSRCLFVMIHFNQLAFLYTQSTNSYINFKEDWNRKKYARLELIFCQM